MPPTTGVTVTLGGKPYTLRFTGKALAKLERQRGEPLRDTLEASGALSFGAIIALIWAGILHEFPTMTVEDVEDLVEPPLADVFAGIMEALKPWTAEPTKN